MGNNILESRIQVTGSGDKVSHGAGDENESKTTRLENNPPNSDDDDNNSAPISLNKVSH